MAKRPTLKDVAQAAGVSLATASYALNKRGSVGQPTREHVLKIAAELGYRPNLSAKATRTGRSGAIGLILPDLTNPFFPALAQIIIQTARHHDYSVFLTNTEGEPEAERQAAQQLVERGVDGLIWFPIADVDTAGPVLGATPTVVVDRSIPEHDMVHADYEAGGRLAAKYLIDRGHRRIGVISSPQVVLNGRQRSEGAISYVERHGMLAFHVESEFTVDLDPEVVRALLSGGATAVIAGADLIAIGAIRALMAAGERVPEDVSVIGFDDIPWAQLNFPRLTSVAMPIEEMGEEAVAMLMRRIASPTEIRRRVVFNVTLAERDSVGPGPG